MIPSTPIKSPWKEGEEISLVRDISVCNKVKQNLSIGDNYVKTKTFYEGEEERRHTTYSLLKDVSPILCKELSPYIKSNCHKSYLVNIWQNSGGTYTSDDYYIYGLFEIQERIRIVPLKQFNSKASGINFIEKWEKDN